MTQFLMGLGYGLNVLLLVAVGLMIARYIAARNGNLKRTRALLKAELVLLPLLVVGYAVSGVLLDSSWQIILAMVWALNFFMARRNLATLPK